MLTREPAIVIGRHWCCGTDPYVQPFDINHSNPPSAHLNQPRVLECLERPLDHLTYRPDHDRQLLLRVGKIHAGGVLDKCRPPQCAVAQQPRHPHDDVAK